MPQKRSIQEEGAVALIFHFKTMDEAEHVMRRLDMMGGLSRSCEGHFWDEEDCVGYAVVDAVEGLVLDTMTHPTAEEAQSVEGSFADIPELVPETFALFPLHLMSDEQRCGGWEEEGEEEESEVHTKA